MHVVDWVLALGPFLGVVGLVGWISLQAWQQSSWDQVRRDRGMRELHDEVGRALVLEAGSAGLWIRGRGTETWTLEIRGLPPALGARLRSGGAPGPVRLGLPWLDDQVALTGPEPLWQAVLDRKGRGALMRLLEGGAVLGAGRIRWSLPRVAAARVLPAWLDAFGTLAECADLAPEDVPGRLARRVRLDEPQAALKALWVLAEHFPEHPALARLQGSRPDTPGFGCHLALARGQVSQDRLSAWVAEDQGHLGPELRVRALGQLREVRTEHVAALLRVPELADGEAVASQLALAPAGVVDQTAWHLLLDPEHPSTALAVVHQLGSQGTIASVPALAALARRASRSSKLRQAAQEAVAQLQARVDPLLQGALSLVEAPRGGQLTLSEPPGAGQLAVTGPEDPASR